MGTVAALRAAWPDLRDVTVVDLDLSGEELDWSGARLEHTMMLGCTLAAGVTDQLVALGVGVFPAPGGLPFAAYRADLYTGDELTAVVDPAVTGHASSQTLDERIGAWFLSSSTSMHDAVIRAVHDATVDAAVARFVQGRRVVGVMGGHALGRDAPFFRSVAGIGRALTARRVLDRDGWRAGRDGSRQSRRVDGAVRRRRARRRDPNAGRVAGVRG